LIKAVLKLTSFGCISFLALAFLFARADSQSNDNPLITLNDCWKASLNETVVSPPVSDANQLYIAQEGGRISAYSLVSGTRVWSSEIGGEIVSNIVPDGKSLYVVANAGGKRSVLRSVSTISGIPNFDAELAFGENVRLGMSMGKIVALYANGSVAAYEQTSGKRVWQVSVSPINMAAAAFTDQGVLVPTEDKKLEVISPADGRSLFSITTRGAVTAVGMIEEDLLWGDDHGDLVRYDAGGKFVSWRYKNGARIGVVRGTERGILAASNDNFVYLLSGYNGDIRWKKRLSGRIASMTVNGEIGVVVAVGDPTAVLINLENGKQLGQYLSGESELFTFAPIISGDQILFFTGSEIAARSTKPCRTN
jgi:outer membrane protein assembly factor BamB